MCFKKWFGKEEVVEESMPVEAPVERKSVDELLESIQELVVQLNLVVAENKQLEERIKQLEEEKNAEYEATCAAKDQIVEILNEKAELERRLDEIRTLAAIH